MNNKNILDSALYYLEKGFSVIPVGADKKPLVSWKEYQNRRAMPEEVKEWIEKYPAMNIAIVTGTISGIVVLDIEKDGSNEGYPPTVTAKSGGEGVHLYYKHPGFEVPNGTRVRELTDVRADGGYVLAPPSVSNKGEYEWLLSPDDSDFSDCPEWITKPTVTETTEKKWLVGKDGTNEGSRNDTAASMAGKILSSMDPKLYESIGWEQLIIWNNKSTPPLSDKELRSVWESIKKLNENDFKEKTKTSQANILLEDIFSREDVFLFHDDKDNGYISLQIEGCQMIKSCRSNSFTKWISNEVYKIQGKTSGSEIIKSILSVIEGKACFEGPMIKLHNRVAWYDNELWYDLTNDKWQAIRINKEGWRIIEKPPIIFNRYPHHKSQVVPVSEGGDVNLFLKYMNISNSEHRLLFLVFLVSCFIPEFPHVMLVIFGAQGSSKSTLSRLTRLVVDPSQVDVASFPNSMKELIQAFAHHYFLFFDNVSHITEEQSDTLCKVITGGGHIKRELYKNDEDIIYNFMRCIGINGINLVTTRPDLLERSLLLELDRIDSEDRKTEKELYDSFSKDLPFILGGIFDVLVRTINLQDKIKLDSHNRMADWTLWGCAIAEALGYSKEEFLNAYTNNITRQTEMLLNENIVTTALFSFMEDQEEWKGTPTDLLNKLSTQAMFANIDTREKYWPKASNSLSRKLNELSTYLKQMGLLVTISTNGAEREICVRKNILKKVEITANQEELFKGISQSDDTDDISRELNKQLPVEDEKPF